MEGSVIARIWAATARRDRVDAYVAHLREKTFQDFNIPPDFDQTIMPQGMRETIPKAKVISQPRATAPVLREEPPASRRK